MEVMGAVPAGSALRREGAQPGDRLCVSGTPGDAAAGLAFLQERWRPAPEHAEYLYERFYRPTPRLELGA